MSVAAITRAAPSADGPMSFGGPIGWTEYDLGFETWWDLDPSLRAALAELHGRRFGYPECCVREFVEDALRGRMSGVRRGGVPDGRGGQYVPCSACCDAMGRVYIP